VNGHPLWIPSIQTQEIIIMSNTQFPYPQSIAAITIPSGPYKNYTFAVSAYASGMSVGQVVPNPTPPNYACGGVIDIDNNGSSSTAFEFLLNFDSTTGAPAAAPYYFVHGSAVGNLWLNSVTPATTASDFSSNNVSTQITEIGSQPDAGIAAILYYPPAGLLYVATTNGNLYWYSVSWGSDGVPSFSYVNENKTYNGASNGQVTLTLFPPNNNPIAANYPCLYLAGVEEATGVIFNAPWPTEGNGTLYGYTSNAPATVAVCRGPNGLYFATPTGALHYQPYSGFNSNLPAIWTVPNNEIILSLAYSPNPNKVGGTHMVDGNSVPYYPNGALFIATSPTGPSNSTQGSMWVCDVASNTVGNAEQQKASISGPPWGIIADVNLNYLCSTGSTGVFISSLAAYNPQSTIPENGMVVPNNISDPKKDQWFADIVAGCALVFGVVTDDPVAVGWAVAGIVAQSTDTSTGY
jgi:hypothetical protein